MLSSINADKGVGLSGDMALIDQQSYHVSRWAFGGTQVWDLDINVNPRDIALKQIDTLLILTPQGLIVLDKNGNIVNNFPAVNHQRIKTNAQSAIACIADDSIFLYSSTYQLVGKKGFAGDKIKDFDIGVDRIAALTEADSVHVFDGMLMPLGSFGLSEDAQFSFISADSQTVILAGMERYGSAQSSQYATSSTFLKEFGFDGNDFGTNNDIGIVGMTLGSEIGVQQITPTSYWVILHDVVVTVKNFGDKTVSSIKLQARYNNPQFFENLNLDAGTEQILLFPELKVLHYGNYPAGQLLDLCIWTSHPDFRLDSDDSNDSYCADFLVNNKDVLTQNSFKLYPNPTHKMLNIQWNGQFTLNNANCRIINAEGKVIKQMGIEHQPGFFSISVEDWNPGVYFIQIFADESYYSEKFVVIK